MTRDFLSGLPRNPALIGLPAATKQWGGTSASLFIASPFSMTQGIAVSNSGRTVTTNISSPSSWNNILSAAILNSYGKIYFEINYDLGDANGDGGAAVGLAQSAVFSKMAPASTGNTSVYFANDGRYKSVMGGSDDPGFGTWGVGARIGIALDNTSSKAYFRKNGVWINNSDPVSGLFPASVSGNIYIYIALYTDLVRQLTIISSASDFRYTIPSGYSAAP